MYTNSYQDVKKNGKEFIEFYSFPFLILTGDDDKYDTGLHEFPFTETSYSSYYKTTDGGIKFYESENLLEILKTNLSAKYIRDVTIPDDATVIIKSAQGHYLSNKLQMSQKILICELPCWSDNDDCIEYLKTSPTYIRYMKNLPDNVVLDTVRKRPDLLEHIENQSVELKMYVAQNHAHYFKYVKNPTLEMYEMAMDKYAYLTTYIDLEPYVLVHLAKKDSIILKHSKTKLSNDDYEQILKHNGMAIEHIEQSPHLCKIAFDNNICAVKHIQDQFITKEMCDAALEWDIRLLNSVPSEHVTDDMYISILQLIPKMISVIPMDRRTDKMLLIGAQHDSKYLTQIVDRSLINNVDPLELIKVNPNEIKNVKNPTVEMWEVAVLGNWELLKLVPESQKTEKVCMNAITNNFNALEFVTNQTEEMCLKSVQKSEHALKYVKIKTKEFYIKLVKLNHKIFGILHDDIVNESYYHDVCIEVVKIFGPWLKHIQNPTYEMCEFAVQQNPTVIKDVPLVHSNEKIVLQALTLNGNCISLVNGASIPMYFTAINSKPSCIEHIDPSILTEEMCIAAVKRDWKVLEKVKHQTLEICLYAVKQNINAFAYVRNRATIDENELMMYVCINPGLVNHIKGAKLKKACNEYLETFYSKLKIFNL